MKKKILSSLMLMTLLVTSMFSSIFIVTTAIAEDIPGTISSGRAEWHNTTGSVDNVSFLSGSDHISCPDPIITLNSASHCTILFYRGNPEGYHNGHSFILAGSIGRFGLFAWHTQYSSIARVDFDVLADFYYSSTPSWSWQWYHNVGTVGVEVTVEGSDDTNDTDNTTCFLAGTKILMDDLSAKNIERIRPGDMVKSIDMITGEIVSDSIVELEAHSPEEMEGGYLEVEVDDNVTVDVTPNHPVMVIEDDFSASSIFADGCNFAFIRAADLKVGDRIFDRNITSINEYPNAHEWSYNLVLENNLNFVIVNDRSPGGGVSGGDQLDPVLDGWTLLKDQMVQMSLSYLPSIAPGVKGNSASAVYSEEFGVYALPMLQPQPII